MGDKRGNQGLIDAIDLYYPRMLRGQPRAGLRLDYCTGNRGAAGDLARGALYELGMGSWCELDRGELGRTGREIGDSKESSLILCNFAERRKHD